MKEDTQGHEHLSGIERYVGREVVIDTKSPYVYLGRLVSLDGEYLVLEDADVHDCSQGRTGKDLYIIEARRVGIQPNRTRVLVRQIDIISISALEEVIG